MFVFKVNEIRGSRLISGANEAAERKMQHFLAYRSSDFLSYILSDFLADIHFDRRSNSKPILALKLKVNELEDSKLLSGAKESAERKMQHFLACIRSNFLAYICSDLHADIHSDRRSNSIPNHALKL